eukprot:COSAG03_NODE_23490_length_279_cov_1.150000_1_plen_29_part_01
MATVIDCETAPFVQLQAKMRTYLRSKLRQ